MSPFTRSPTTTSTSTTRRTLSFGSSSSSSVSPQHHQHLPKELEPLASKKTSFLAAAHAGDVDTIRQVLTALPVDDSIVVVSGQQRQQPQQQQHRNNNNSRSSRRRNTTSTTASASTTSFLKLCTACGSQIFFGNGGPNASRSQALDDEEEEVPEDSSPCKSSSSSQLSVNVTNQHGWTALHVAAVGGHTGVVECLLEFDNLHLRPESALGWTPLQLAAHKGHTSIVQALANVDPTLLQDTHDTYGTPLHMASQAGHVNTVLYLMRQNNNNNNNNVRVDTARPKDQWTALHVACHYHQLPIVQVLVHQGHAQVDARDVNGYTPFMVAVQNGHLDVVEWLLEYDANLVHHVTSNPSGATPLHLASWYNHVALIRVLLQFGAGLEVTMANGKTPLDVARKRHHQHAVDYLTAYQASLLQHAAGLPAVPEGDEDDEEEDDDASTVVRSTASLTGTI